MLTALLLAAAVPLPLNKQCADGNRVNERDPCPELVFFDSGETEIRREWTSALDRAAALAASGQKLVVTGHSDTPGSAAVNRRVGLARAREVARALTQRGVPAEAMTVRSAGEEQLLVPTADGVREIQNRRVTITLQP
jgi:outer membrane protein OmpA-like peptidoglycan-associated protein